MYNQISFPFCFYNILQLCYQNVTKHSLQSEAVDDLDALLMESSSKESITKPGFSLGLLSMLVIIVVLDQRSKRMRTIRCSLTPMSTVILCLELFIFYILN